MTVKTQDARKQAVDGASTNMGPTNKPSWREQKRLLSSQFPQKALVYEGQPSTYWQKPSEFGWTVAHYAAGKGHVALLKALAAWGVNLWTPGTGGRTPAHWAATNGHKNCLCYLLGLPGADVNASNNSGWALVHCAACQNNVECMQLLLEKGANPEATNNKGETARGATRSNKVRLVIDRFTQNSSESTAQNKEGEPKRAWDEGVSRGRQGTAPQTAFCFNAKAREFMPMSRIDTNRDNALNPADAKPTDTNADAKAPSRPLGADRLKLQESWKPARLSGEQQASIAIAQEELTAIRAKRREERAKRKALRKLRR